MSLDVQQLGAQMLAAALGVLKKKTPEIEKYATDAFRKIAQAVATIAEMAALGRMTAEEARLHFRLQKEASRTVLLTVEGLGQLEVEAAIDAGLAAVRDAVNALLPFKLL